MSSGRAVDLIFCSGCGNLLDLPQSTSDFVTCELCNQSKSCHDFESFEVVTRSRPNAFRRRNLGSASGGGNAADGDNEDDESSNGAIIEEKCGKCGHGQMRFFTMQLRSADEGQTVFYTCLKCNYTYKMNS